MARQLSPRPNLPASLIVLITLPLYASIVSCTSGNQGIAMAGSKVITTDSSAQTIDAACTPETKALYCNLKKLSSSHLLFGQQDALAYGIGWKNEDLRSDVHDVCGSFPAICGWDLSRIGDKFNIDTVDFGRMKYWIRTIYEKGGINEVSWHLFNPVTGGSPWDVTKAVTAILPGGSKHEYFKSELDQVAAFFSDLKSKNGTLIPIIFRPWHEHNGNWFWWGENLCTREEYIALWQFTVKYLRDVKGVHNLLYAYSPDRFFTQEKYLERFPGKDYIDVLGLDDYGDFQQLRDVPNGIKQLRVIVHLADSLNKISALTETGCEKLRQPNWFTEYMLNPIKSDPVARRIAWILVWRNANKNHFYTPYPGHPSTQDFLKFEADPYTFFMEDLPPMYSISRK